MKRLGAFQHSVFSVLLPVILFAGTGMGQQDSPSRAIPPGTVLLFTTPPTAEQYELTPGDKLFVRVFGHPELSSEVIVDERGMIGLPFIDEMEAAGRTVSKLRNEISLRFQTIVRNPQVHVQLVESTRRESVKVYGVKDNRGHETDIYTSMMRADALNVNWQLRSLKRGEFVLSFFSRNSFSDGRESYEAQALLDGKSLSLGRAIKIFPTVVTAHNDPYLEIRLRIPLTALAQIAKAGEVKMKLGNIEFKLRENDLKALRFIVSHVS